MTGPFHAIGILRPQLATSGFGICADESASHWHSGATLDVLRGINHQIANPSTATVFPGRNATVALNRFITESPNPLDFCGWTGSAGLPLIAMMPGTVTSASATLAGPAGPVQTCVLHGENTNGTAQSILRSDNAVVVVPREPLAPGTYTSTVNTTGGNVTWSFTIDPNAELQPPSIDPPRHGAGERPLVVRASRAVSLRRLPGGPQGRPDSRPAFRRRSTSAMPTITAVSANFTVDRPSASGFLTVYNCSAAVPVVSTLNFTAGAVPNQAFVPLSQGKLCLYSPVDTEIIIDVNGYFRAGSGGNSSGFYPRRTAAALRHPAG